MDSKEMLNPQQLMAALHVEGPLLVLAGAGSGKTRVVTERIKNLLKLGIPSGEILAVTFTNKAAEEMRLRVESLCGVKVLCCTFHSLAARILRSSITPLGFSSDFIIYDEDDSEKLLKMCFKIAEITEEKGALRALKERISEAKNALIAPTDVMDKDEDFIKLYTLYQQKLKEYGALDFDDLLFLTVDLFRKHPVILHYYQKKWRFLLIDEYQDTNPAQDTIARLLVGATQNIFAVGDPDQSIYSWRGANIDNILHFEKSFPGAKVVALEQNYRSSETILAAANSLISNNINRYEKKLWSSLGKGELIQIKIADSDRDEARFITENLMRFKRKGISYNDCVLFFRTNFQSRVLEDALIQWGIPYELIGGLSFYQRKEIKDVLALMRLVLNPNDFLSFARIVNCPKRGLGESALSTIRSFAEEKDLSILSACKDPLLKLSAKQKIAVVEFAQMIDSLKNRQESGMPLAELLREAVERSHYILYLKEDPETFKERESNVMELISKAAERESDSFEALTLSAFLEELSLKSKADSDEPLSESVKLMTLHNGKGLEFKVVFLTGMEEELFPHVNARGSESALEEERRLAYVGMTRAKEFLFLTASLSRYLWGTLRAMRPSRFLKEIPKEYMQGNSAFQEEENREMVFEVGARVKHKDFGVGVVEDVTTSSFGVTYKVYFLEEAELRTLVAKYARLSLV